MTEQLPPNTLRLLDFAYLRPIMNVSLAADELAVTFATANKLVESFERLGLLHEVTGRRRDRIFRFSPYLALFETEDDRPLLPERVQETEQLSA